MPGLYKSQEDVHILFELFSCLISHLFANLCSDCICRLLGPTALLQAPCRKTFALKVLLLFCCTKLLYDTDVSRALDACSSEMPLQLRHCPEGIQESIMHNVDCFAYA